MSGATNSAGAAGATWPADVIHVNEDGWVLVNRGRSQGVFPGLRLLVVGTGVRELRNLFAGGNGDGAADAERPVVLRTRRTYEQLEVVYAEDACAVAIATRTPPARRPTFYRGPDGELLVWVPLPEGFTYPQPGASAASAPDDTDDDTDGATNSSEYEASTDAEDAGADTGEEPDIPPEHGEQDDERWEEALPLNGVAVGDLVVPAIPAHDASAPSTISAGASAPASTASEPPTNPFESGRSYDWMQPER